MFLNTFQNFVGQKLTASQLDASSTSDLPALSSPPELPRGKKRQTKFVVFCVFVCEKSHESQPKLFIFGVSISVRGLRQEKLVQFFFQFLPR